MRKIMGMCVALAVLAALSPVVRAEEPKEKQYQIIVSVFEGDPEGSREAGTIRCLACPVLVTREDRPASFFAGGEFPVKVVADTGEKQVTYVPYGIQLTVNPKSDGEGGVYLEVTFNNSELLRPPVPVDGTDSNIAPAPVQGNTAPILNCWSTSTTQHLKPCEVLTLMYSKDPEGKVMSWVEIRVEERAPVDK